MMREIYNIINPVAGGGKRVFAEKIARLVGGNVYYTVDENDIERFVISQLSKNPYSHFIVYGGDGTINCCVNGIMKSGCNKTACFTAFSLGSGNDFLTYINEDYLKDVGHVDEVELDVIEADGKYSINVLNTGFDCTVVTETDKFRRKHHILGGKFSYTVGVLTTFVKKETFKSNVKITYSDDTVEELEGDFLLIAIGNCQKYGGGYRVAPFAHPDDGLMDVLIARNLSRPRFLTLLSIYKSGAHLVKDSLTDKGAEVISKFKDILSYHRCKTVEYDTAGELCYDGEIHKAGRVVAKVVSKAIKYVPMELKAEKVNNDFRSAPVAAI